MPDVVAETAVVQLEWREKDGSIVVTPRDGDRWVIRLNRAIEILGQSGKRERFEHQTKLLQKLLAEWINGHTGISSAYLTVRDGAFAFIIVRDTCEYDDEFEDELSALDLRIAEDPDLDLVELNTLALPNISAEALSSFLHPEFKVTFVHGDGSRSHSSGE
jgi:hypothetical protein